MLYQKRGLNCEVCVGQMYVRRKCGTCIDRIHFSVYMRKFGNTVIGKRRGDGGRVECTVGF